MLTREDDDGFRAYTVNGWVDCSRIPCPKCGAENVVIQWTTNTVEPLALISGETGASAWESTWRCPGCGAEGTIEASCAPFFVRVTDSVRTWTPCLAFESAKRVWAPDMPEPRPKKTPTKKAPARRKTASKNTSRHGGTMRNTASKKRGSAGGRR